MPVSSLWETFILSKWKHHLHEEAYDIHAPSWNQSIWLSLRILRVLINHKNIWCSVVQNAEPKWQPFYNFFICLNRYLVIEAVHNSISKIYSEHWIYSLLRHNENFFHNCRVEWSGAPCTGLFMHMVPPCSLPPTIRHPAQPRTQFIFSGPGGSCKKCLDFAWQPPPAARRWPEAGEGQWLGQVQWLLLSVGRCGD